MALQHELCNTRVGVPELNTAVLGARKHPVAVRCEGNTENEVLVTFECADALAAWGVSRPEAWGCGQLPHLDSLVERSTDKPAARRSKCNTVDAVLVAFLTLKTNDELTTLDVPNADTLVERSGGNIHVVGRDSHGGNAILDLEIGDLAVGLKVPKTDTAIA